MSISSILPSLFLRRLVLLLLLGALAATVLGVQMARLTIVQGDDLRKNAERKLVDRRFIPTQRGHIKDRTGKILAKDAPSFDIAFNYDVIITGLESHAVDEILRGEVKAISQTWAEKNALFYARQRDRSRWADLNDDQREALVTVYLRIFRAHAEAMWNELASKTETSRIEIDRRRQVIRTTVGKRVERYVDTNASKKIKDREEAGQIQTPDQIEAIKSEFRRRGILEQKSSHVILPRVGSQMGFQFLGFAEKTEELVFPDETSDSKYDKTSRFPGLDVRYSGERQNPYEQMSATFDLSTLPGPLRSTGTKTITVDGVACHIVGRLKNTFYNTDVDNRTARIDQDPAFKSRVVHRLEDGQEEDLGRYLTGDRSGLTGIEAAQELELRAERGLVRTHMDTQVESTIGAVHGRDVRLTIDIELQARIQGAMSPELGLAKVQKWHGPRDDNAVPGFRLVTGDPLYGAAVVIDIETGEIMAMVSTPTFTRQDIQERKEILAKDEMTRPLVNRAIHKPYAPGSIVKALMLSSAISRGKHQVGHTISCTGHFLPGNPNILRCWIFKRYNGLTHDMRLERELSGADAIMVSCNIFFYTLGQRLGGHGVRETFRDFGLGRPIDIGLGPRAVYVGPIGFREDSLKAYAENEAIQMAIGQGPVDWTPLHAADAFATIARGGLRKDPTLIKSSLQTQNLDIGLSDEAIRETLDGLSLSINDVKHGTGNNLSGERHFNVMDRGVQIWGKTGTADGAPIKRDTDGDGKGDTIIRDGDHSWFLVLVGNKGEKPRYSIAVVMDYAGSGGKVSGPIVNQIVHALCDLGYLKGNAGGDS